jgi:NAD(P)-dependent dehydrogenase (short-subunit alcohol dehydrogenase family)
VRLDRSHNRHRKLSCPTPSSPAAIGASVSLWCGLLWPTVGRYWQPSAPQKTCRHCALAGDNQLSLHTMDLMGFDSIDRLAQSLDGTPIDVLPSNGAITGTKSTAFGETDYAVWADLMRANAIAQMRPAEALAKNVAASDRNAIIFISSPIGPTPNFGYVNYWAVKSCCRLRLALKDGV